ncbi:ABC transporter permease [Conexibacter woesei]|uniref:Inner-membrane translocator n=1 Tax=Conexibacter woesei (strain DSM 14684 / CCUG 47730 / CIP 108061 / JCM 11494 / NBRC 100937 / ID131577) TaxID=469383 RepID=D3F4E3_CONWI|nr:ABC transporter permease [Conexibacter woesei]ADB50515.1 inner-membrane translocator [Conexibacter woesei DSM 14684]
MSPPEQTAAVPSKLTPTSVRSLGHQCAQRGREYGVLAVFAALFVALSLSSDAFLTTTNLLNIVDQWAAIGIIALAATLVLISGGFDLSVAAVFSVTGVIAAKLATSMGVAPALALGVLSGLGFGLLNGLAVVGWKVNSIIATLATGIVIGGIATNLTGGNLITVADTGFTALGQNELLGITLPTWFFAITAVLLGFLLHKTVYGRYVYAVGGNIEAARLSGVRTGRITIAAYGISGLAAGFAGVMVASQQATGQAGAAPNLVFDVVAAVIVGGTSILGGSGAIWRTVVGIGLLALIQNGATLLSLDETYRQMITGAIILCAAAIDVWARSRTGGA